ncbi:tRNA (adenosine(37)-N6)-dimethylallyltransferase MiaA, partial [candidate division KSB1 bacterium]|nr:tRNA (adenosine(37)-N6)-dimethylallyltransferase MiaA [candidate division KSB1 bacterium]
MNWISDLNENRALLLVGATAVGKTELSLELAERLNAEIVSADSRQVYRQLDIGTAKPTAADRARAVHHFIDIRDPDQDYSAGEYGREARRCLANLLRRGKCPLVVGGSGFYLRALVDGLFAPRISSAPVKEKWQRFCRRYGVNTAHRRLAQVDPDSADRLHPNDMQRVVRALEVYELSGIPISRYRSGEEQRADFTPVWVGLWRQRDALYRRIDERTDRMIVNGLVEEVMRLQADGYGVDLNALRTVGYREVFALLRGELNSVQMVEEIKKNTRHYAKRQMTWFRRDARIHWIDLETLTPPQAVAVVTEIWKNTSRSF